MKTHQESLGMWLGVLGVAIFAVTLPMTRLATGTAEAPQLSPWFVTLGRAALAGLLSVVFLLATRSPVPQRQHWRPLGIAVLGNAVGYPLLLGYALRVVTASHAAVITALCIRLRIRENQKKGGADKPNRHEKEEKSQ